MANYAPVQQTGNGVTQNYAVPWPYIDPSHVQVTVNGVIVPFTWLDAGTVRITTPPANGSLIVIRRVTPGDVLVEYQSGYLRTEDLNYSYKQALFVADEQAPNGSLDLAANSVLNEDLADMPTSSIKGRATAGTGDPEDLTASQVKSILGISISDVSGLQTTLDAKSNTGHTHAISDVTGLQTALDGKAAVAHTHTTMDISGFNEGVDDRVAALLVAGANISLSYDDTVNALTISSSGGGGGGSIGDGNYGDIAISSGATVFTVRNGVVTNDKLANVPTATFKGRNSAGTGAPQDLTVAQAKTLLAIGISDVASLQTTLDAKANTEHTHAISDVTGLQTALDGKASTVHTHVISDISGLGSAATRDTGTSPGNVPVLDASGRLPAVDGSQLTNVAITPSGSEQPYAGIKEPSGWVFAFGQNLSRTADAALFNAITLPLTANTTSGSTSLASVSENVVTQGLVGAAIEGPGIPAGATIVSATATTITLSAAATASGTGVALRVFPFGNGDGSTTFTLPDRRGRTLVGRDNMGGTAAGRVTSADGKRMGLSGGAETHTLTTAQMPLHGHAYRGSYVAQATAASSTTGGFMHSTATVSTLSAFTGTPSNTAGQQIGGTGGGQAHNNMQPFGVTNWIIKL